MGFLKPQLVNIFSSDITNILCMLSLFIGHIHVFDCLVTIIYELVVEEIVCRDELYQQQNIVHDLTCNTKSKDVLQWQYSHVKYWAQYQVFLWKTHLKYLTYLSAIASSTKHSSPVSTSLETMTLFLASVPKEDISPPSSRDHIL